MLVVNLTGSEGTSGGGRPQESRGENSQPCNLSLVTRFWGQLLDAPSQEFLLCACSESRINNMFVVGISGQRADCERWR